MRGSTAARTASNSASLRMKLGHREGEAVRVELGQAVGGEEGAVHAEAHLLDDVRLGGDVGALREDDLDPAAGDAVEFRGQALEAEVPGAVGGHVGRHPEREGLGGEPGGREAGRRGRGPIGEALRALRSWVSLLRAR